MKNFQKLIPSKAGSIRSILTILSLCFIATFQVNAQTHTFPTFSPGAINSSPTGAVTTVMPVAGITGDYFFFSVEAEFVGSGTGQTSWSSTIEIDINDGNGLNFVTDLQPTSGGADDGNNTTIFYYGSFPFQYAGGDDLSIEFFDGGEDGMGPYNCTINNVIFTIEGFGSTEDVTITGAGATTVTGSHPDFIVSSTDTQLSEAEVDAFVANNGYVTSASPWNTVATDINFTAGSVGIGTATPTELLHLSTDDSPGIKLSQDGTNFPAYDWEFFGHEGGLFFRDNTGGNLIPFWIASGAQANTLTVLDQGRVGINNFSPNFELQVNGSVDVTGELTAASDRQLKKNIVTIDNANAQIASLNPVSYFYRTDEFPSMNLAERKKMGLIAQDVLEIFPNLVSKAGTATKSNGEEIDILSVNYMEMIPLLIKAVQEHELEIKNKDAQIALLMEKFEKIDALEDEMAQLKASMNKKIDTGMSTNLRE